MINLYENMNIDEILDRNLKIYGFVYFGSKSVAANSSDTLTIAITSDSHFLCKEITGTFTTLTGAATDGGANGMNFRVRDEGRGLQLFNNEIPCSLAFSPGRVRTSGVAGDPSHQLFWPKEFIYPFLASSTITIALTNNLAYANTFSIDFWGTKYRVSR